MSLTFDPHHLLVGENPPDRFSQYLANTIPSWTAARQFGLPTGPTSLTPLASGDTPAAQGSYWQRFINTFAVELDIAWQNIIDVPLNMQLAARGHTFSGLDNVYRTPLQAADTTVLSVSANIAAKGTGTQYNLDGTVYLDPLRTVDINLLPAPRLYDFVYGVSVESTVTASTSGVTISVSGANATWSWLLPNRVGLNPNGSSQIEWVTVNGVAVTSFSLATDQQTITVTGPTPTAITVHFTTYDVYYVLLEDLPVIYTRMLYYELLVTSTGTPPDGTVVTNLPGSPVSMLPSLWMVWNEFDNLGLYLNRPRRLGENNQTYQRRLIDTTLYPANATADGLRNALATELDLVTHLTWGPGGNYTSSTITIGSLVAADSIRINRLPLDYYSITSLSGATGAISLAVPGLAIGQEVQVTLQLLASGQVIPRAVPLLYSTTNPASASAIYSQITVDLPRLRYTGEDIDDPAYRPSIWYPGSLCLWKNGLPLVSGVDFNEFSSTVFVLTALPNPGDIIQLGFIYEQPLSGPVLLPELEAQPDIETDLSPIVRIGATYTVNPSTAGVEPFTGWKGVPFNLDTTTLPTLQPWTITFTVTNVGSAAASGFSINVTLPPLISYSGSWLTASTLPTLYDLRYIDGRYVTVAGLSDPSVTNQLYDRTGRATAFLKYLAEEISSAYPLEWGSALWGGTFWHTLNEPTTSYGFLPNSWDPDYTTSLAPTPILGAFAASQVLHPLDQLTPVIFGASTYTGDFITDTSNVPVVGVDFTKAGTVIAQAPLTRYEQFQSGIGFGTDGQLSLASDAALGQIAPLSQQILNGTNQALATPASFLNSLVPLNSDAWWATFAPGPYYLNQEQHLICSSPITVELYSKRGHLSGATQFTPMTVRAYNPANNSWISLRRCELTNSNGIPTTTFTETVSGAYPVTSASNFSAIQVGYIDGTIITTFSNITNITCGVGSDGNQYTVTTPTVSGNQVYTTPALPLGVTLPVTYSLVNAYTIQPFPSANMAAIELDQVYAGGVVVTYDVGAPGTGYVSGFPLHPYFNPRQGGFVYLRSVAQLPQNLKIKTDPPSAVADGITTVTVYLSLTDSDGAGCAGQTVTLLVGWRGGPTTYELTTDVFGNANFRLPSSPTRQTVPITAMLQHYTDTNAPHRVLTGSTSVEFFTPYQ
jgi:hypothetical protein